MPVVLSYLVIGEYQVDFFVHQSVIDRDLRRYLEFNGIRIYEYDTFYETLGAILQASVVMIDPESVNYRIFSELHSSIQTIECPNPAAGLKHGYISEWYSAVHALKFLLKHARRLFPSGT